MMECKIPSVAETVTINEEGNNTLLSTEEAEIMLQEMKTNSKTSKKWAHIVKPDFEITMKIKHR